jgi:spore maturation protein CgeB
VRFLIIDANYPGFLDGVYAARPELAAASYDEQVAEIRAGMFGEAGFQVDALRALGHEADVIVTNALAAQRAWAIEHSIRDPARPRPTFRLRRGVVPWVVRRPADSAWDVVLAQVREYRPDVLYVSILDTMPTSVVAELRSHAKLVIAQVATAIPKQTYRGYDLVMSSIPALVDRFRHDGIEAEYVPLAFEPAVLGRVPDMDRDVAVSFVGSFSAAYLDRLAIVETVARAAPLQTWTPDTMRIPQASAVTPTIRGSAFGRDMYAVLARSRLTLNTHGIVSGSDANNLRLFEATGMGALLVTDHRRNLGELFDAGTEVVTYRDPGEAAAVVNYYLDHPLEAARIAAAGQARTLREHTWADRMAQLVTLTMARL